MNEEILYNEIYEKTKDCGRTQFVKLLMDKERENQELKKQLEEKNKTKIFVEQNLEEAYGDGLYLEHLENKNQKYKEVIDKAIKYIEKNMNQKLYTGEEIFDTYSPATDLLNILEEVE